MSHGSSGEKAGLVDRTLGFVETYNRYSYKIVGASAVGAYFLVSPEVAVGLGVFAAADLATSGLVRVVRQRRVAGV